VVSQFRVQALALHESGGFCFRVFALPACDFKWIVFNPGTTHDPRHTKSKNKNTRKVKPVRVSARLATLHFTGGCPLWSITQGLFVRPKVPNFMQRGGPKRHLS
jgi:hypothetical protein